MKKFFVYLSFIISIGVFSCKEMYDPKIGEVPKILVVEGIITNEVKPHQIFLSHAIRFDTLDFSPETGAKVFVTDNLGNTYLFKEKAAGYYYSDSSLFKPQIGLKYTLNIETSNKEVYKSSEQELLPKGTQNDISNIPKKIRYYYTTDGNLKYLNVTGAEFYTTFKLPDEPNPYFRFSNTVMVQYTQKYSIGKPLLYYTWKKYNPNEYFNINLRQYNYTSEFQHDLGFFPIDSLFYSVRTLTLPIPGTTKVYYKYQLVNQYLISLKQYHLNEDTYKYYESLNTQLEAKQRIFDPISYQLQGNMKCVSDSSKLVFGLFEASSVDVRTYQIDYNLLTSTYKFQKIKAMDMDTIQELPSDTIPPKFWIY